MIRLRRRGLTAEELKLWAHVTGSVSPLKGRKRPHPAPEPPPAPEPAAPPPAAAAPATPRKPPQPAIKPLVPLERRLRQRVSRGRQPVDGVLDLHGMRQAEAHRALLSFISAAHRRGDGVVLVVTGKGNAGADEAPLHGEARGVLRRLVPHWLAEPSLRHCVIGFEEAGRGHGGGGALYVRIRRAREGAR
jgi:DNA-nicking Smr family endonuclease